MWYLSPSPGPPVISIKMPLLNEPGATRSVVPETLADIWSIPFISIERAGQDAKYADTGGWCDTCSVMYTTRTSSELSPPEPRERFDIWPERPASAAGSGEVEAVEGLGLIFESRLIPLRMLLELRSLCPLLMLIVSEGKGVFKAGAEWVYVVWIPNCWAESGEYGGTSQCERKCSPRTEL